MASVIPYDGYLCFDSKSQRFPFFYIASWEENFDFIKNYPNLNLRNYYSFKTYYLLFFQKPKKLLFFDDANSVQQLANRLCLTGWFTFFNISFFYVHDG